MTSEVLLEELNGVFSVRVPLILVIVMLREFRMQGVSRGEVQSALERRRESAPDKATEDRILEVLDIVRGFCPPEKTVWDDCGLRLMDSPGRARRRETMRLA